jgi:hypothetical protein
MMSEMNNNAAAAVVHKQWMRTTLWSKTMQRIIRNGPSEDANAEAADEASDKTIGAWVALLVSQYSTGSTLESKWLMLRVRNSIFRWYSTYCISVLTTNMHREWCTSDCGG